MNPPKQMHGGRTWFVGVVLLIVCALVPGCAHTGPSMAPIGEVTGFLGCKDGDAPRADTRVSESCVRYEYDGMGTLTLKHVDGAFNCGATSVGGDVEFSPDAVIRIDEWESVPVPADCLCLFDIDYRIAPLVPDTYRVIISEPYLSEGNEPFDFVLDLNEACTGQACLPRVGYPWNHDSTVREPN